MRLTGIIMLIIVLFMIIAPEVVVSQETTTTTPSIESINITLPRINPYTVNRIDVSVRVSGLRSIIITLVAIYSTNPWAELYPVNIRIYNNLTSQLIGSIYYNPNAECFEINEPYTNTQIPGNLSKITGIQTGRWTMDVDAKFLRIEVYRVVGGCDLSGYTACPGDPPLQEVLNCSYIHLYTGYLVLPEYYEFPESLKPLFDSMFMMLIVGMFVAFILRGDIRMIGIGMILLGGLIIPFLYLLSISVSNAPLISVLLVVAGLLVLWLNK